MGISPFMIMSTMLFPSLGSHLTLDRNSIGSLNIEFLQGDRSNPAIVTFHDVGFNCKYIRNFQTNTMILVHDASVRT